MLEEGEESLIKKEGTPTKENNSFFSYFFLPVKNFRCCRRAEI